MSIESQAEELQTNIVRSVSSFEKSDPSMLLPLSQSLKSVPLEVVNHFNTPEWTARVDAAVTNTLYTRFKLSDGQSILPWEGGRTIVIFNLHGDILSATYNPQGEVYQEYNENLFPHAMTKALQSIALYKLVPYESSFGKGLDDEDNFRFIQALMDKNPVYLGESIIDIEQATRRPGTKARKNITNTLVIGASGCELTAKYKSRLAGTDVTKWERSARVNYLAGRADMIFAQSVARNLNKSLISYQEEAEPGFFASLSRSH